MDGNRKPARGNCPYLALAEGELLSRASQPDSSQTTRLADRICAVVVAFFPDQTFEERLQVLLPQVDALLVVDNTPGGGCAHRLKTLTLGEKHIFVVEMGINIGIAGALNRGLERAREHDCNWLLTLDQDTLCYPDLVETLLRANAACNLKPAVIGGNYLDPRTAKTRVPKGEHDEWLEQKTVITSGCLVDVAIAQRIGGFREDYFIDQVDHEFCLRMRAHDYRVVITRKIVMAHSVGEPDGPYIPFLGVMPSHSPLRKYYITRNSLITVAGYWRTEPEWCIRRSMRLLLGLALMALLEKQRIAKLRAFAAGVVDGMNLRTGPCRHNWLKRYNCD